MKPKVQKKMTECVVIGPTDFAGQVMAQLNQRDHPTRCFPPGIPSENLRKACDSDTGIKLVAVFTRGLPDHGKSLIHVCKSAFGDGVPIQVFQEGRDRPTEASIIKCGAQYVHSEMAISLHTAVGILKRRCEGDESLGAITVPRQYRAPSPTITFDPVSGRDGPESEDDDEILDDSGDRGRGVTSQKQTRSSASALPAGSTKPSCERAAEPSVPKSLLIKPAAISSAGSIGSGKVWKAILDRVKQAMANAEYIIIHPSKALPMPDQPRAYFNEESLQELAVSISEIGQFVPGIVRRFTGNGNAEYQVLDGERRWRAITLANIGIYKAMLVEIDDEAAPFVIASIANFNREGHTHIEISDAIERLHVGLGMPMPEVAKMYGIAEGWAYQLHQLQKLHPQIRNMLDSHLSRRKRLGVIAAIAIAKGDVSVQEKALEKYQSGAITLKGLRQYMVDLSEESGTYIRKRRRKPSRIAESALRQAGSLLRGGLDLAGYLGSADTLRLLSQRDGAGEEVADILKKAVEEIERCLGLLGCK